MPTIDSIIVVLKYRKEKMGCSKVTKHQKIVILSMTNLLKHCSKHQNNNKIGKFEGKKEGSFKII